MNIFQLMAHLDTVPRWSIVRTVRSQSVAEHSYNVCWILQWVAAKYKEVIPTVETLGDATLYAVQHDALEGVTGDTPSVAKQRGLISDHALPHLEQKHGLVMREPGEKIGRIVKLCDMLEAYRFMRVEVHLGNFPAAEVADDLRKRIVGFIRDYWWTVDPEAFLDQFEVDVPTNANPGLGLVR